MIQNNNIYNMDAISFMEQAYEEFGDESIEMFLVDFPYTFKGRNRVTANKWDLPVDTHKFFEIAMKMLTEGGAIVLTATNPFASYLISNHLEHYKYEWIWEKDNGSNFVHVKHQPFRVHEQVLVFGKSATTYVKSGRNMLYNPQFTYGDPYTMKRDMSDVDNLQGFKGRTNTNNKDGRRYPRSVQKFNLERGLHPTQKPVSLFEYLIKTYTNKGDTVIDCCAGSGSTAVAAVNTGRSFIVNDNNMDYCELMEKRVAEVIDSIQFPEWFQEKLHLHENGDGYECGCNPESKTHCLAGEYLQEGLSRLDFMVEEKYMSSEGDNDK